ncbi:hypothetical protein KKE14_00100 [Patescibacteria group bacterium]|nr:hypothetical protein [Patescibacteria group bacterium]
MKTRRERDMRLFQNIPPINSRLAVLTVLSAILFIFSLTTFFLMGCANSPITPNTTPTAPEETAIVGEYDFTHQDGSIEGGSLVYQGNRVVLVPERGTSALSNWWFEVDITYLNPLGWLGDIPLYNKGDWMRFVVNLDYKRGIPLDRYPLIYSSLLLSFNDGTVVEKDPLLIPRFGEAEVEGEWWIPTGLPHGNYHFDIEMWLALFKGRLHLKLLGGELSEWHVI